MLLPQGFWAKVWGASITACFILCQWLAFWALERHGFEVWAICELCLVLGFLGAAIIYTPIVFIQESERNRDYIKKPALQVDA